MGKGGISLVKAIRHSTTTFATRKRKFNRESARIEAICAADASPFVREGKVAAPVPFFGAAGPEES